MTPTDLLLLAGIPLFAMLLVWISRRLAAAEDWINRISRTHATLYSRLAEYAFWTASNLLTTIGKAGERRRRLIATAAAASLFAVIIAPALLAGSAIHSTLVQGDSTAIALGVLIWSAVVEIPGLPARLGLHFGENEVIPVLALVFVISVMDVLVCGLALSHLLDGKLLRSALTGVGLVAVGDLISGLIGLAAAAALPRPLADPCPCWGLPSLEGSDDGE